MTATKPENSKSGESYKKTLLQICKDKPQAINQYAKVKLSNKKLAQQLYQLFYRDKIVTVSEK